MLPDAIVVTSAQARRFMLRALGLVEPFENVAAAIAHHGFVQLDPINVCGRMHDLILRNRVRAYREGDLLRHLYGSDPSKPLAPAKRVAFEHYFEILAALPLAAWPFLVEAMRARTRRSNAWGGKLSRDEEALARRILRVMEKRGPLGSDDIEHDERSLTAWGTNGRLVKIVLEKLFFHGRVLITTRRAFRRMYDLPERVLPAALLAQPTPSPEETRRWQLLMAFRQRRLVRLNRRDASLIADRVQPVRINGNGAPLYCLQEDAHWLDDDAAGGPEGSVASAIRLLAPLDPVIYDREVTRRVWDFNYTWEVYTPPAKRVRGYYALPVLAGETIAGHVDPKADRERGRLVVVSRRARRGVVTAPAVAELAQFLGLR